MHTPTQAMTAAVAARPPTKSRWPARMDLLQSLSGLALGLFMWGHMMFVSSILLGKDAMWTVTKFFEGYFFFGRAFPGLVTAIAVLISALLVLHAFLAMRKFPANWRQYHVFGEHRRTLRHMETTLWWFQVLTGFALFFLAFPHVYKVMVHPLDIGPYESARDLINGRMWLLYLPLLFAVEIHAGIGMYRLAMKWQWFVGSDPAAGRRRLRKLAWGLTLFLIALGLTTMSAYARIGLERQHLPAEKYVPSWVQKTPSPEVTK